MNDQVATVQQASLSLPALPKLTDLAHTFWKELLLGRLPAGVGEGASSSPNATGGRDSRWS